MFLFSRERDERKLQQRTNPKGSVTVNVNATDLFSRYKDDYDYDERLELQILMCIKSNFFLFASIPYCRHNGKGLKI